MAAVYRVTCDCGGFAVATISELEARKFATFHSNLNSDRDAGIPLTAYIELVDLGLLNHLKRSSWFTRPPPKED